MQNICSVTMQEVWTLETNYGLMYKPMFGPKIKTKRCSLYKSFYGTIHLWAAEETKSYVVQSISDHFQVYWQKYIFSFCVVHTKTSIPLSVNESGWYLNVPRHFAAQKYPPLFTPLQWIVLHFNKNCKPFINNSYVLYKENFQPHFQSLFEKDWKSKFMSGLK